jgi:sugar lactone lactonase YvrE
MSIDRPCSTAVTCPCNDSPVMNLSVETDDPINYPSIRWPDIPPDIYYKSLSCLNFWCYSLISQEEADLCAQRYADLCSGQTFLNTAQTCVVHCPDGTTSSFTCPAGVFAGDSQAAADAKAMAWACQAATLLCTSTTYYNTAQTCTVTCPDGSTASFTVPAGVFYAPSQAAADLQAYNWACSSAASLCTSPTFFNIAQTCTTTCPNGATTSFTTPAGTFYAATQAAADAQAYTYACQTAVALCAGTLIFNTAQTCTFTCPDGSTSSMTCAAGTYHAATLAAANAIAYDWACGLAVSDCKSKKHKITLSSIAPVSLTVGDYYQGTIHATGAYLAVTPYQNFWQITSGSVPSGLTFMGGYTTDAFVNIQGTPTVGGTYHFTVKITAPNGDWQSKNYTLTPTAAPMIYVADSDNSMIRKMMKVGTAWVVSTLAGSAGSVGSDDGVGTAARFDHPWGVAVDGQGYVYVADTNNCTIRKISPMGVVVTLAGQAGYCSSDDGSGDEASFSLPHALALDDAGNIYVADFGASIIRQVSPAGYVNTIAGTAGNVGGDDGQGAAASFFSPSGIALDSNGNLFVTDYGNHTIRMITPEFYVSTVAGLDGSPGHVDANGSIARFNKPWGITIDADDNLYVAEEGNNDIRKITPAGDVTTLAVGLDTPVGMTTDGNGTLFIGNSTAYTIRTLSTGGGGLGTIAGFAGDPGNNDGTGGAARFNLPTGVTYY